MEMKETDHVYQLRQVNVGRSAFEKAFAENAVKNVNSIASYVNRVIGECKALIDKRFVMMKNKKVWYDHQVADIPIFRPKEKNAQPMSYAETVAVWLKYELIPQGLSKKAEADYQSLMSNYKTLSPYLDFNSNPDSVRVQTSKLVHDVLDGTFKETVFSMNFDLQKTLGDVLSGGKQFTGSSDGLKQQLLNCDHIRCALMPYPEKRLTDINLGHWELFEEPPADSMPVLLPAGETWTARPPQMDVYEDGVCAIDFGTKSTVVACQRNEARLLRIGNGDFRKEATLQDYENPTCIELRDFGAFWEAYTSRDGRPFTEWEQLTVSHQAASVLLKSDADSSDYYAVFSELKQWANAKGRRRLLKDRKHGNVLELKPYLELDENSFDPIEIYAYYLGLAINNMFNGIYLDYTLSFPVNYSKEVREHLLASFRRGLRKSLMPALLKDEAVMSRFRVYAGASEPAAYAMAALKAYHLQPTAEDESIAYGVFDFGGGTTDFDFGIERLSKNRRKYKYQLEEFGQGGDVYLGGEHLLNDLAYAVYKKNRDVMRKEYITFALPPDCTRAAGMEGLLLSESEASQMAFMNRKCIAELLRPLWEHTEGYEEKYSRPSSVTLYSSSKAENESKVPVELEFSVEELEAIIKEHIDDGVDNFFHAMSEAFQDREPSKQQPIHIFLAGNSCRSVFVRKSFAKHIEALNKDEFVLHEPLGTETENGDVENPTEFDQRLTGKTGVAFGLLRSRKGGKDVRIVNKNLDVSGEVTFRYFLGDIDENERFHVRISRTVGYNVWKPFCYADEEDFEIWYTSKPAALENQLLPEEVQKIKCRIKEDEASDEDDVKVFIRRTKPDCLEYAVGRESEFNDPGIVKQKTIYQRELK